MHRSKGLVACCMALTLAGCPPPVRQLSDGDRADAAQAVNVAHINDSYVGLSERRVTVFGGLKSGSERYGYVDLWGTASNYALSPDGGSAPYYCILEQQGRILVERTDTLRRPGVGHIYPAVVSGVVRMDNWEYRRPASRNSHGIVLPVESAALQDVRVLYARPDIECRFPQGSDKPAR